MGARQSKRVEISSASKKGDAENGAIVSAEEKLEKIEEGETAVSKTNANGSTTTSSTVTAEQQETVTSSAEVVAVPETTPSKEVETKNESVTEVVASPEKSTDTEATSPTAATEEEGKSAASPSEVKSTEESGAASSANEKKKKDKKKKWSFRSFSFSKKDRQKPVASKDDAKQRDLLPEDNEAVSQAEQQNDDEAEKTKKVDEENKKKEDQVPPPLPTSPPPTPAEEIAVVAASVATPAVPVKEESQIVSEGDVDASGGGEALAEPLEEGELEQSTTSETTQTTTVSTNGITSGLTNGTNGTVVSNGKTETEDLPSPVCELKAPVDVESVTTKIDSLKLQIATDSAEPQPLAQNGLADASSNGHSFNGECNGTELNGSVECPLVSDSVVSVDRVDVSADVSADN